MSKHCGKSPDHFFKQRDSRPILSIHLANLGCMFLTNRSHRVILLIIGTTVYGKLHDFQIAIAPTFHSPGCLANNNKCLIFSEYQDF